MPFAYYDRLSAARQRTYRRSDAIETVEIPDGFLAGTAVAALRRALAAEAQRDVQSLCQQLNDALSRALAVPPVRMRVLAERPSDDDGELHGLYEPEDAGRCARITVWMRTAQRQQVVAFKSFLRTLVHEFLPPPRLRALRAAGDLPHRGLLQARVEPRQRAAGAGSRRRSGVKRASWPRRRLRYNRAALPEERCNRPAPRRAARLGVSPFATALVEPCTARGVTRAHSRVSAPPARSPNDGVTA